MEADTTELSAKTSTGREAEGEAVAGRTVYGQPAVAGSVNTKYQGDYAAAAKRNPYGGYTTAAAGPYGGKVTTTLPSGYRVTSYHGHPYDRVGLAGERWKRHLARRQDRQRSHREISDHPVDTVRSI